MATLYLTFPVVLVTVPLWKVVSLIVRPVAKILVVLSVEHLFSDRLVRQLVPMLPLPRIVAILVVKVIT